MSDVQPLKILKQGLVEATRLAGKARLGDPKTLVREVLASVVPVKTTTQTTASQGTFVTKSFRNAAGERVYKLYVPSGYRGVPLPLVVMMHGCTQSPDDFAAGTRMNALAEERTFFVAYPAQASAANASKCWNWFKAADQRRDAGEPSIVAGLTRQIVSDYAVDTRRVYVAGLSAGGAAAAVLGATYPDVYAAVGVHSGLPTGAARDVMSALSAMRQGSSAGRLTRTAPPTIVFHGDNDATVHPSNGAAVIEQATRGGLQSSVLEGKVNGGRAYSRTSFADASGAVALEYWVVHGSPHAWSGGSRAGSFTDPLGPDATKEMTRFFFTHALPN